MGRAIVRILLLAALGLCAGCGTFINVFAKPGAAGDAPLKVYGGVDLDRQRGKECFARQEPVVDKLVSTCEGVYYWGLDLPASAIGDTLTLPQTVNAEIARSINNYYFPESRPRAAQSAASEESESQEPPP